LRLTVNVLPQTMDLATKSGLPLGAVIHPLAEVPGKEVRVIDSNSIFLLHLPARHIKQLLSNTLIIPAYF
jgi:hypothetical protein